MHQKRVNCLIEQAKEHNLDVLALVSGPNLFYFTDLSFHLSERPVLVLFPIDDAPAIIVPTFEAVKVEDSSIEMNVFSYTDEEGYTAAFQEACDRLRLAKRTIGAEAFRMRMVEVKLLEQYAPGCNILPAEEALAQLRMHKDQFELEQMRRAIDITEKALRDTMSQVEVGWTEREVAALLKTKMFQRGGEGMAFSPIVVAGPNAALPHATPGDRPIQPGETIVVDCGAILGGYAADITRTFAFGELGPDMAHIYEVVRAANAAGRAQAGPRTPAEEVDRAARKVIEEAGYGEYFKHRTGHGLGLDVHEPPYIVEGNERILKPGMTFTVEPGIYLPGQGGVRIEDDVLVTEDGAESLTMFPREFAGL